MKNISIILPVFNEKENLALTLDQLFQLLTKIHSINYEVIAIDDGSTDESPEILKQYNLKIIHHPQRRGYGASLKDGIKNSKYNNIAILDSDGSYPPSELYRIIKYSNSYPLIIGTRANYFSLIRHFANKMLALLASLLFRKWITDLNSGMRLFNKLMLQKFNFQTWPNEFSFTTNMTLSIILANIPLKQISIRCASRHGHSKLNIPRFGVQILKTIFRFFKQKYKK
jgi:glycosyltransferase involved in cell wall biosynthesis